MTQWTDRPSVTFDGPHLFALQRLATVGARTMSRRGHRINQVEREALQLLENATVATHELAQRQPRQPPMTGMQRWVTAPQLAKVEGISVRTVQRNALAYGGVKHKGVWMFPPPLPPT